ncbi:MAG: ABC transporter ATP-binding protein [Flavobacteriales bacterium]
MKSKNTPKKKQVQRLLYFAKPYRKYLAIAMTSVVLLSIPGPLRPKLIGRMVDEYIVKSHNPSMLLLWSFVLLGILLLEGLLQLVSSYFSNLLAQSVIRDLRKKIIHHFLRFRMSYFDKNPVGAMVTRVVSDMEAITEVFSSGFMEIISDLFSLLFILVLMFWSNWELAWMTLVPIPFLLIATRIFARSMKESFQQERLAVTRLNTFVQERLSGMSIVQLFHRERKEYQRFEAINEGHRQAHLKAVWANSIFFPVVETLSSLSIAFLLVWGALHVSGKTSGEIQSMYGEIFAFTLWINQLYRPIRQLADKFNILQRGTVRAERVFDILDEETDLQEGGNNRDVDFSQDVHFKKVSFSYVENVPVLKNIDLTIHQGETVAFVGATGAGKSTIVNLLGRFYEHTNGEISIGNVPIQEIYLPLLRKNIAIVLQDVFLFSDSIHNNITLGDPQFTREQVIEASIAVGAHDFIMKLPNNYDHQIGERGGVLSVGQRQLLAFIRAYVYAPEILILDEATSNVDSESEQMIQAATEKLTTGRTSIVIAHRLSTVQKADRIAVLEKGELVEIGSHQELLQIEHGYYKRLYEMQFFNQKEEDEKI